jgi:asparagine synthase (glutamine-hydrolysing)
MCGICGFNYGDKKIIKKMADVIKHRGPDGEGFYINKSVSLGHRRLSIIDLKKGQQPIYNENKDVVIIFNGEIYNFQEIKPVLEKNGHHFITNSDTEVIVHSYEEYGFECLKHFNGMFAFCIYDQKKDLLFMARDRFGIKPFYYYWKNEYFVFASEIKALLANPHVKTKPNDKIIYNYLINNQIPEGQEETFFTDIKKLMPGHYAIFSDHKLRIKKYYSIRNINNKITDTRIDKVSIDNYRKLLVDSVRLRLISDVPVGSCLSGGLDSSAIVAVIDELLKHKCKEGVSVSHKLNCFSAVYQDKSCDERKYIKAAVKNKRASVHHVFPDANGFFRNLKTLVYHQDEPTETMSVYAQYCVMKLAKGKVRVLLDGQGSDESVAGYIPYYRHFFLDMLKQKQYFLFIKEVLFSLNYIRDLILSFVCLNLSEKKSVSLFTGQYKVKQSYIKDSMLSLAERQLKDFNQNLPKVLRYEDRNSMAHSIESRLPFLDYRLVEYSFSIPESLKLRNGWTKYILRQACNNILDPMIKYRKNKFGFPVPDYYWLIQNKKKIKRIINSSLFKERPYFNYQEIIKTFDLMCKDKKYHNYSSVFWRIINLELWLQIFFNKI